MNDLQSPWSCDFTCNVFGSPYRPYSAHHEDVLLTDIRISQLQLINILSLCIDHITVTGCAI